MSAGAAEYHTFARIYTLLGGNNKEENAEMNLTLM